jgi:hypothetical protein
MKAPALELADIFRIHGPAYLEAFGDSLSAGQKKAVRDISVCRTAALGGYIKECDRCGHRKIAYRSCRNRHCSKCQAAARAAWLERRAAELLPVEYFTSSSRCRTGSLPWPFTISAWFTPSSSVPRPRPCCESRLTPSNRLTQISPGEPELKPGVPKHPFPILIDESRSIQET